MLDTKPGDHLCCIYQTEEEHRQTLSFFLREGLERSEKVVYIAHSHSEETVLDYLRTEGLDVQSYRARGQLRIVAPGQTYLREGRFDPDSMIAFVRSETERALAEGYAALRGTGEMTWVLDEPPGSQWLIEYESKLNDFLPASKCLALCQYDKRRFTPEVLLDVLCTHPMVLNGSQLYDNPYYVPPSEPLTPGSSADKLQCWIETLVHRGQRDRPLPDSEVTARALLNAATDSILLIDFRGIIRDANRVAAETFGKQFDELLGVCIWDLMPLDLAARRKAYCDGVFRSGKSCRFEDERDNVWNDNVCCPVVDEQGSVARVILVTRNITDRKALKAQLLAAGSQERHAAGQKKANNEVAQQLVGLSLLAHSLHGQLKTRGSPEAEVAAEIDRGIRTAVDAMVAIMRGRT